MDSIFLDGVEYRCFDHIYAVSREGKFLRYGEPFDRFSTHTMGYVVVGRQRLAHRVVATCWCERGAGATHVHHKNHDKTDNRADNLEWVSPKEHIGDRHIATAGRQSMTESAKQKLREYRAGRTTSDSTKEKQRRAALRLGCRPPPSPKGVTMSPEGLAKAQAAKSRSCVVDGVAYASFTEAGLARGEKAHSLRKRCLSPNFPNYQLGSG